MRYPLHHLASARTALAAMVAVATVAATGCTSTGPIASSGPADAGVRQAHYTVRGQSQTPHQEGTRHALGNTVNPQLAFGRTAKSPHDHLLHTPIGTAINDHLHNTQVGYYDASTPICGGVGAAGDDMCPTCPGAYGGHFGGSHLGGGHFGGGMYAGGCPDGRCGGCAQCVRNVHTYRVQQPKNLSYPQPNAVGGAVVYPYYTHKGPSDFFRD